MNNNFIKKKQIEVVKEKERATLNITNPRIHEKSTKKRSEKFFLLLKKKYYQIKNINIKI